ncbi:MAG: hypothetical protein KKG32_05710, partial [Alphaproteobacteria bacterium]|nr:hypothetical protein [Alphaproteobacteria bacterium]
MMLFVRGIMGNIKLNPAITLWGSLLLFLGFAIGGLGYQIFEIESEIADCRERGGVWVGGVSLGGMGGIMRRLPGSYCSADDYQE